MLLCFVKTLLLFEPVTTRTKFSFYARPHLPHFLSLPHSQNPYIQICNIPNHLRTLWKNRGVYPQKRIPGETQRRCASNRRLIPSSHRAPRQDLFTEPSPPTWHHSCIL